VAERTQSPYTRVLEAHLRAETGQPEAAVQVLDEMAGKGFIHPTHNVAWLGFMTESAWLTARFRRKDCVPPLRATLEPFADQLVVGAFSGWVPGSVAFYLGLLCTTIEDWVEADAYFVAAEATEQRIRAPILLARTRLEWARMLLERRGDGDVERARQVLGDCLDTARERGLVSIERDAGALRAEIP
jgi:hypothetical protein